jgi:hypothetical protein
MARAFRIKTGDNVATLLDDICEPGAVRVLGEGPIDQLHALEAIALGHKIALEDIPLGEAVVKFGVPIGRASREILAGQWVHLHNCTSRFDERSQTLDLHTGAATDTKYE